MPTLKLYCKQLTQNMPTLKIMVQTFHTEYQLIHTALCPKFCTKTSWTFHENLTERQELVMQ